MMKVAVLGSGCAKCKKTAQLIEETARALGREVEVVKETDPEVMMRHGVMSTPAVVVDGVLVHSGSLPERSKVEGWLRQG